MLYPLRFKPRFVPKPWGGRKLADLLGKALPGDQPIGESWELYDFPPGVIAGESGWVSSIVANGPLAGRTLHSLVEEYGPSLMGDVPLAGDEGQFPLLFKFLDARQNLSLQVHPTPAYAARHPGAHVKNEAWYVVQAEPGARLYKDLVPGVTRESFRAAIERDRVMDCVRAVEVKRGHSFYLPSGTVHALGAGVLIAEVQTPSDTTFRVYDWGRVRKNKDGRIEPLDIEPAVECIDFGPPPAPRARGHVAGLFTTVSRLVACPSFTMEKVRFVEGVEESVPYDQPVVWMMLEGKAQVKVAGLPDAVSINPGDTVLLPAKMRDPVIKTMETCVWLEVTMPSSNH